VTKYGGFASIAGVTHRNAGAGRGSARAEPSRDIDAAVMGRVRAWMRSEWHVIWQSRQDIVSFRRDHPA
jgi:hypothetical protein